MVNTLLCVTMLLMTKKEWVLAGLDCGDCIHGGGSHFYGDAQWDKI